VNPFAAGAAYALLLLLAGTVFGTARVLLLAPQFGEAAALAIELPAMLIIAWIVAGHLVRRLNRPDPGARATLAASAALLFFAGEIGLGWTLLGRPPSAWAAGLARPTAVAGLAAQLAALALPILRRPD
jgi:hypothetical protein